MCIKWNIFSIRTKIFCDTQLSVVTFGIEIVNVNHLVFFFNGKNSLIVLWNVNKEKQTSSRWNFSHKRLDFFIYITNGSRLRLRHRNFGKLDNYLMCSMIENVQLWIQIF